MCTRCLDALGACRSCHSDGRVRVLVGVKGRTRCYEQRTCEACGGDGWRPEARAAHNARPLGAEPADSDEEAILDVIRDSETKALAVAAMKIVGRGRPDLRELLYRTRAAWDHLDEIEADLARVS